MKKSITALAAFFLLFSLNLNIFAETAKPYSWYCARNSEHKQPSIAPSMSFIEEYNGYYVDKKHGDSCTEKVVYLTFDAGYENGNISKILDILKEENVSGAFFILEQLLRKNPELVIRMSDEGHIVANHTAKHKDISKMQSKNELEAELLSLEKLYTEITGRSMPKYFRPPEGKFSRESMIFANELGYKTIFWSFAYADWDNNSQPKIEFAKNKILSNIHNGAIILLHPTSSTNATILGDIIKELKSQGYVFKTLDDLTEG